MIECVGIATCHNFPGNVVADQHRLRYREVIEKECWGGVYVVDGMEFDRYDNLATEYYVARDVTGAVVGVARAYPTTIPYMLDEVFAHLAPGGLPAGQRVLEASRLVLDRSRLDKAARGPVIDRLVTAYIERGLERGLEGYVGFMLPKIWASTFVRAGWEVEWLGPEVVLPHSGDVVRAAWMPVNEDVERNVRERTGIWRRVLNFGADAEGRSAGIAVYSDHEKRNLEEAA